MHISGSHHLRESQRAYNIFKIYVFLYFNTPIYYKAYHITSLHLIQIEKQNIAGYLLPFDSTMVILAEALSFPNLLLTWHMYSPESASDALLMRSSDFL